MVRINHRGRRGKFVGSWSRLTLIGTLFSIVGACTTVDRPLGEPNEASTARSRMSEAHRLKARGDYLTAASRYTDAGRAAARASNTGMRVEASTCAGECWLKAGNTTKAWMAFQSAKQTLQRSPNLRFDRRSAEFRIFAGLGDLEFLSRNWRTADQHYRRALALSSQRARETVLERLALVAEASGNTDGAQAWRRQLREPSAPVLAQLRRSFSHLMPRIPVRQPSRPTAASQPSVRSRGAWGAAKTRSNYDRMEKIWRVTVHHTGELPLAVSASDTASLLRRIQKHHQNNNGWADIGYHYLIDVQGRIWEGRPIQMQGAHAGDSQLNRGNIGVALFGDFTHEHPTRAQLTAVDSLLDFFRGRYRIAHNDVYMHNELVVSTQCPGGALERHIAKYRRAAAPVP